MQFIQKGKCLFPKILLCILVPFLALAFISANVKIKMKRFKITEGVTALLPNNFMIMSDDDLAVKYPSSKKPLAMFTNPDRLVDFGLNVSKSKWPGNDLTVLKKVYKATIMDMYSKVEFIQDDIKTINKRDFIVFEYTSQFESQKNYTYLQYALVKDQVYLFNFTSPERQKNLWQPVASKIMNSIKMNIKHAIDVKPVMKPGVKKYEPKKLQKKAE